MRIRLTKYGLPQAAVFPALIITAMIVCGFFLQSRLLVWAEVILVVLLVWVLSFFRDPYRQSPAENDILVAPADGTIKDIETVRESDFICGPALRIGIFLSVFNVHINRAPGNVKVEKIVYKKGKYKDARDPQASRVNESNMLGLMRKDKPTDKLVVRQISGAIARRIVCGAKEGQELTGGERFGMIKFGSRTELYLPMNERVKCLVKTGDKVKAGVTVLVRYE